MQSLIRNEIALGVLVYFIFINLTGFILMGMDKKRAIRHEWRIPEKILFTIAILFGSVGIHLGMKQFRHKTKHTSFVIGIPVIQVIQVIIIVGAYLAVK